MPTRLSSEAGIAVQERTTEPHRWMSDRLAVTDFLQCMRPYQWTKNFFVLAPLLFGQRLGYLWAIGTSLLAFASFCLMCSALYVINDIVDAAGDRAHPEKRSRPVASGRLPRSLAWLGCGVLLVGAFLLGLPVGSSFLSIAGVYFGLMLLYCLRLKHTLILDGMVIAAGFVLRVVGGAVAVDVVPSHWLVICSFLLALYLAFAKRRRELLLLSESAGRHRRVLHLYTVPYLDQVNNILVGAVIICYALYTVAPDTVQRFGTDQLIYGTAFVIYGLLRYLALIQDPRNGGDPSKLLIRDKPLLLATLGWVAYNAAVIYRPFLLEVWQRF